MAFTDSKGRRLTSFTAITGASAATSTETGTPVNLGAAYSKQSLEVVTSDTGWIVQLQGSLSGGSSSWMVLTTHAASSDNSGDIKFARSTAAGFTGFPITRVRTVVTSKSSANELDAVIAVVQ